MGLSSLDHSQVIQFRDFVQNVLLGRLTMRIHGRGGFYRDENLQQGCFVGDTCGSQSV